MPYPFPGTKPYLIEQAKKQISENIDNYFRKDTFEYEISLIELGFLKRLNHAFIDQYPEWFYGEIATKPYTEHPDGRMFLGQNYSFDPRICCIHAPPFVMPGMAEADQTSQKISARHSNFFMKLILNNDFHTNETYQKAFREVYKLYRIKKHVMPWMPLFLGRAVLFNKTGNTSNLDPIYGFRSRNCYFLG